MVWGVIVAAVSGAIPINPIEWVNSWDYPELALREHRSGSTEYTLVVSSGGRPQACEVTESSGSGDLDMVTCAVAMRRGNFEPARNAQGSTIVSLFHGRINWSIPGTRSSQPRPMKPDMEVSIARMPSGIDDPATISVAFAVDENGRASDCTPVEAKLAPWRGALGKPDSSETAKIKVLGAAACREFMKQVVARQLLDQQGRAVSSVQTAMIRFSVKPPAEAR